MLFVCPTSVKLYLYVCNHIPADDLNEAKRSEGNSVKLIKSPIKIINRPHHWLTSVIVIIFVYQTRNIPIVCKLDDLMNDANMSWPLSVDSSIPSGPDTIRGRLVPDYIKSLKGLLII